MEVTPLDLRQPRFQTVMRGYDRGEVQAFLLEATGDYENALRENDKLHQEVAKLDAVLGEHRGQERNLRNTLEDIQREIDGLRMKRREVENNVEALSRTLASTLEFIRDQDVRSREERVLLHRPRAADAVPTPRPADVTPKSDTQVG